MAYRCEVPTPESAVQLIAASYLRHGYYWHVSGTIPARKSPAEIDQKLIQKYNIDISAWERSHRKKRGLANVQYIRWDRWFILLVTEGHHPLKAPAAQGGEKEQLKDCRRHPIRLAGYSISYRRAGITREGETAPRWHAHVRIDGPNYERLKSHFLSIASHRSPENLRRELAGIRFARYAPVRRQLLTLLRKINEARARMGYESLPHSCLNLRRQPVKVYAESHSETDCQSASNQEDQLAV